MSILEEGRKRDQERVEQLLRDERDPALSPSRRQQATRRLEEIAEARAEEREADAADWR